MQRAHDTDTHGRLQSEHEANVGLDVGGVVGGAEGHGLRPDQGHEPAPGLPLADTRDLHGGSQGARPVELVNVGAHIGQGLGGIHAANLSLGVIGQRGLEGRVGGGVTQEGNVNGAAS